MTKSELRRYCIETGFHVRLSNRRIMLHQDDIQRIVGWLRQRNEKKDEWWTEPEHDPFK